MHLRVIQAPAAEIKLFPAPLKIIQHHGPLLSEPLMSLIVDVHSD